MVSRGGGMEIEDRLEQSARSGSFTRGNLKIYAISAIKSYIILYLFLVINISIILIPQRSSNYSQLLIEIVTFSSMFAIPATISAYALIWFYKKTTIFYGMFGMGINFLDDRNRTCFTYFDEISHRDKLSDTNKSHYDKLLVMKSLERRCNQINSRNTIILSMIGVILTTAALIFIFAGRLTSLDIAAVNVLEKAKSEFREAQSRGAALSEAKRQISSGDQVEKNKRKDIFGGSSRDEFSYSNSGDNYIPVERDGLEQAIKQNNEHQERLISSINEIILKQIESENRGIDIKYLVATAITRIGVVLILVFLVQILLNLYRYNTRILSYYNSYRDIIGLWHNKDSKLEDIYKKFGAPNVNFDKEPQHPTREIIGAIDKHLSKIMPDKKNI
jgi:hypothetical protein